MTGGVGRRGAPPRGFALILVLWFLVLLGAIGTYLLVNARAEVALARNILVAARAEALADAGVAQAAFNLSNPVLAKRWPMDGTPVRVVLPGGEATIRIEDENQKVNPNLASESLLAALIEAVAVERGLASRLAAAIADWVDPDDQPRPQGAEKDQYLQAGLSVLPPNAPVDSIEALRPVMGMTAAILAKLSPYLTVYGEADAPDPARAAPLIRRAVEMSVRREQQGEITVATAPSELVSVDSQGPQPTPAGASEIVASVEVTARSTEGGLFIRRAALRLDPQSPTGYVVLDWQRGEPPE